MDLEKIKFPEIEVKRRLIPVLKENPLSIEKKAIQIILTDIITEKYRKLSTRELMEIFMEDARISKDLNNFMEKKGYCSFLEHNYILHSSLFNNYLPCGRHNF